jgi:hypothetical protein
MPLEIDLVIHILDFINTVDPKETFRACPKA